MLAGYLDRYLKKMFFERLSSNFNNHYIDSWILRNTLVFVLQRKLLRGLWLLRQQLNTQDRSCSGSNKYLKSTLHPCNNYCELCKHCLVSKAVKVNNRIKATGSLRLYLLFIIVKKLKFYIFTVKKELKRR